MWFHWPLAVWMSILRQSTQEKAQTKETMNVLFLASHLCCVCLFKKPDFMFRRYHVFRVLTFIVLCNHQSNASLQDALHPFSYDDMSSLSNNQDSLDSSSSFVTPRNVKGSSLSSPPGHTLKSTAHSKNLDFNTKTPSTHCKRCDRQVDRNSDVLAVVRKNFHDYPQFYPFAANLRSNDVIK